MASSAPARDAGGADREPTTPILEPRRVRAADLLAVVVLCAAAELVTVYGDRVWQALDAVWGIVRVASPLPGWSWWAAPAVLALLLLAAAWAVAFARHRLWRALAVTGLVVCLVAPGLALGWLDASVGAVGHRSAAATRTVRAASHQLRTARTGRPVTILLLGVDHRGAVTGGRSDTQILVRLDPRTGTVSMLSLPRDLRTDVPGVGVTKLNAAYAYGGAALALRTIHQLTGVPINHFVTIDFSGFWKVVDILGGVYLPVDHRYYVPASADYKSIDLQPGYQLVRAKQALNWVRFRHDQKGDFTRMVRQQLFLREVRRQAGRWSGDWPRLLPHAQGHHPADHERRRFAAPPAAPGAHRAGPRHRARVHDAPRGCDAHHRRRLLRDGFAGVAAPRRAAVPAPRRHLAQHWGGGRQRHSDQQRHPGGEHGHGGIDVRRE